MVSIGALLSEVRKCTICANSLPLGPRPIVQMGRDSRILIVGQAPGRKVHESGKPFDDASGNRLRKWMGISTEVFYDPAQVAIVPIGLCFPGTGPSGDLPPRPECAPTWHSKLLGHLNHVQLKLVIGQYALQHDFPDDRGSVASMVARWREHGPEVIPLPHPSWRNNRWLSDNPWFESELVPVLQERVRSALRRGASVRE
jgi:uracil-DNA glycosylase